MTEFIQVTFPEERDVFINGERNGRTQQVLRTSPGRQTINLGEPKDYEPQWRRPDVTGTSSIKPLKVTFEKKS